MKALGRWGQTLEEAPFALQKSPRAQAEAGTFPEVRPWPGFSVLCPAPTPLMTSLGAFPPSITCPGILVSGFALGECAQWLDMWVGHYLDQKIPPGLSFQLSVDVLHSALPLHISLGPPLLKGTPSISPLLASGSCPSVASVCIPPTFQPPVSLLMNQT